MHRNAKIYVAGHRGLVGNALVRCLKRKGYTKIITRTHAELDLTDQSAVRAFFAKERPEYVFLAAAKVGGIYANNEYPAEFIYQNLAIQSQVIHAAYTYGVKRLLFLGSSCIYPRDCPQPMKEEYLLTGPLEPTNRPYAVAKISGVEMCRSYNRQYNTQYLAVMPTNLYGPGDNYDLNNSHVIPALIRKFHLAKLASNQDWDEIVRDEVTRGQIPETLRRDLFATYRSELSPRIAVWGTGSPRREFLYSDDMADACAHLMSLEDYRYQRLLGTQDSEHAPLINIGSGKEVTIHSLAVKVANAIGYRGELIFDATKPDGTPRKLLDVARLTELGWKPVTSLDEGLKTAYSDYLQNT